jgi:hypothetical protein
MLECPGLQRLDRTDSATNDPGDVVEGEVGDEAEDDHLTLTGGELAERGNEVDVEVATVVDACAFGWILGDDASSHAPPAHVVNAATVGNGEHPAAKVIGTAAETTEIAGNADEHVADQVLGLVDTMRSEIAEHRWSEGAIAVLERR